ncbi:class I SAM-dependent methyltransferase [Pseudomonas panipatensis]|uniref:class I SAM-dependent methyltransferase n=1 Tax=Pseudomonas panipatensis TaxID=428992 RepID=UPI0035B1A77D
MSDPNQRILQSWQANAQAWTRVVREQRIDSRRLATDAAILDALMAAAPRRVLDIGCGEGWLCRALGERGCVALGVDAAPALIAAARQAGGARFEVLTQAELAAGAGHGLGRFDALVCNFALFDEDLAPLLRGLQGLLAPAGRLLIQTLHPWSACGEQAYADGWRLETFAAFADAFSEPMPWYFRTLESWLALLHASGWRLSRLGEPCRPDTGSPCSLLLIAELANDRA